MTQEDIDLIYETFLPLQRERVVAHADLIPGALAVVRACRSRGYKIGSTTGYPREVMQPLLDAAAAQGYEPDCLVCSGDEVAGGRPGPWMALACVNRLAAEAVWRCVKVDDTPPGIEEGIRAGMWTVGVTLSGSLCGITEREFASLTCDQKQQLKQTAELELKGAGAHFVIDTVADLLPVLDRIDGQIRSGLRP